MAKEHAWGYLQRRIDFLFDEIEKGSVNLTKGLAEGDAGKQLIRDLREVKRREDGSVDVSSCSPLVRVVAKALFSLSHYDSVRAKEPAPKQVPEISADQVSSLMKEYFQLVEDFFVEVTGKHAEEFDFEEYRLRMLSNPDHEASSARQLYAEYIPKIGEFHSKHTGLLLGCSSVIGGLKCVLGGSSRFPGAAFDGVRKVALYADTIFIPDPLLPWIEVDRRAERFSLVNFLLSCHILLLLKPLVDANLSYPPIVVFPSWEKSLEKQDVETQDGISQLILGFFSYYLGGTFEDESELVSYIEGTGRDAFVEKVNRHRLFWPPGEDSPLPFDQGLQKYREWLKEWRSKEWLDEALSMSPQALILNGIMENIVPQFHVRDNATSLEAQPLFWLSPHFYYFRLISQAGNDGLRESGLLRPSTQSSLQALLRPRVAWLGNVPVRDIARLREEGANEQFRSRLSTYLDELHEAALQDIDRVAASAMRGIQSLLDEHDREARRIAEEYGRKHWATVRTSILTAAVAMYSWLDPWLGLGLLVPVAQMATNVIGQLRAEKALSRSLTGVLAHAHH